MISYIAIICTYSQRLQNGHLHHAISYWILAGLSNHVTLSIHTKEKKHKAWVSPSLQPTEPCFCMSTLCPTFICMFLLSFFERGGTAVCSMCYVHMGHTAVPPLEYRHITALAVSRFQIDSKSSSHCWIDFEMKTKKNHVSPHCARQYSIWCVNSQRQLTEN